MPDRFSVSSILKMDSRPAPKPRMRLWKQKPDTEATDGHQARLLLPLHRSHGTIKRALGDLTNTPPKGTRIESSQMRTPRKSENDQENRSFSTKWEIPRLPLSPENTPKQSCSDKSHVVKKSLIYNLNSLGLSSGNQASCKDHPFSIDNLIGKGNEKVDGRSVDSVQHTTTEDNRGMHVRVPCVGCVPHMSTEDRSDRIIAQAHSRDEQDDQGRPADSKHTPDAVPDRQSSLSADAQGTVDPTVLSSKTSQKDHGAAVQDYGPSQPKIRRPSPMFSERPYLSTSHLTRNNFTLGCSSFYQSSFVHCGTAVNRRYLPFPTGFAATQIPQSSLETISRANPQYQNTLLPQLGPPLGHHSLSSFPPLMTFPTQPVTSPIAFGLPVSPVHTMTSQQSTSQSLKCVTATVTPDDQVTSDDENPDITVVDDGDPVATPPQQEKEKVKKEQEKKSRTQDTMPAQEVAERWKKLTEMANDLIDRRKETRTSSKEEETIKNVKVEETVWCLLEKCQRDGVEIQLLVEGFAFKDPFWKDPAVNVEVRQEECDGTQTTRYYLNDKLLKQNDRRGANRSIRRGDKNGQYICIYCPHRSGDATDMCRHIRTHTLVHPFKCDVTGCGMDFKQNVSLETHKKNHHGVPKPPKNSKREKKYVCEFTGELFSDAESFLRHEHTSLKHLNLESRSMDKRIMKRTEPPTNRNSD